jgi:hypothetical protein
MNTHLHAWEPKPQHVKPQGNSRPLRCMHVIEQCALSTACWHVTCLAYCNSASHSCGGCLMNTLSLVLSSCCPQLAAGAHCLVAFARKLLTMTVLLGSLACVKEQMAATGRHLHLHVARPSRSRWPTAIASGRLVLHFIRRLLLLLLCSLMPGC